MKKVAILDGQTIQTLPVARSLKKLGYYVILLCDTKNSYGYRTKYADELIITPSTKEKVEDFHAFFIPFLKENSIDIIIPMNDYSAQYMSLNKILLLKYCSFIIPDYEIFIKLQQIMSCFYVFCTFIKLK